MGETSRPGLLDSPGPPGETPPSIVRVIAGSLGGRRLLAPKGLGTRPTSDRVREALFMSLEPLAGLAVIDLFAGSGALGIEALSRGASHVDFVERDRAALTALEKNLDALGVGDRATVWRLALPRGLAALSGPLAHADLVMLDPPYGGDVARATLDGLGQTTLSVGVRIVVEHHLKDELPDTAGCLERARERRYGETCLTTYRVASQTAAPDRRHDGDAS